MTDERDLERVGQFLSTAGSEDLVAFAVVAGEPAHVLYDAVHAHIDLRLPGHGGRSLGDALGGRLRSRYDVDLRAGKVLGHRQGNIAGARGHIDEHEIRLTPIDVVEKLLEGFVEHRAAPDDGAVVFHHESDGHGRHAVADRRDDEPVDDIGHLFDTEHFGDREAVDVGVEHTYRQAAVGQRNCQVHRRR